MLNKLMNKILGGTVNTTDNQGTAQVPTESNTGVAQGEQKPRRRTNTRRPAQGEQRSGERNSSETRTRRASNGRTTTRRTRSVVEGELQQIEHKPRQSRRTTGESAKKGENTRARTNTRRNTSDNRNGETSGRRQRINNRPMARNHDKKPQETVELIGRQPAGSNKGKFQIIPLGGLGEIGKKYDCIPIRR